MGNGGRSWKSGEGLGLAGGGVYRDSQLLFPTCFFKCFGFTLSTFHFFFYLVENEEKVLDLCVICF